MTDTHSMTDADTASRLRGARARRLVLVGASLAIVCVVVGAQFGRRSPRELFHMGLEALERGDLLQVASAIESLDSRDDSDPHARFLEAALQLRRGNAAEALELLKHVPQERELRAPTVILISECLYRLGRSAEAEPLLRGLLQEEPDQVEAHRWLGAIYYDQGADDAAMQHVRRVIELDPDDYRPQRLLGLMYSDFEQYAQAIEHYRLALELNPPPEVREEVIHELAHALIEERQYAPALEYLTDADSNADNCALRGECYWNLGDHSAARDCLRQAHQDNSNSRLLDLLAARIELEEGAVTEAVSILEDALKRDPHDAECRYQLAMCWRQIGDEQHCEEQLRIWRETSELIERRTQLNMKAIEHPHDAAVRDELAQVCDLLGRAELADMWRRAAAMCRDSEARNPDHDPGGINTEDIAGNAEQ